MHFQSKKIGIASTAAQLGNTIVLKEIERMITGGAELFIIITDPAAGKWYCDNPIKELLKQLAVSSDEARRSGTFFSSDRAGTSGDTSVKAPSLDLLVIISGFPGLLKPLAELRAEDCTTPLVLLLIPSPGEKPAFPQLSSLIDKEGVFFVPFGPLGSNQDKDADLPLLCSRIDLLGDACSAALQGNQLRPYIWDNHQFPH